MKINKKTSKRLQKIVDGLLIFAFTFVMTGFYMVNTAQAAPLTSKSDTMSRLQAGQNANHTIKFTTPTGVAASATITVTFPAGFTMNSLDFADLDLEDDSVDVTLAATPSGTTWGAALVGQVITFTNGSTGVAAGSVITIEIGTNATSGDTQITNHATPAEYTISIGGTFGDTGSLNVPIIADDTVHVTATVNESISFSISDVSVGFGTLTSLTGRWATADEAGADASATTPTAAHNLTVATNAGGWAVTYEGSTLEYGTASIDPTTGITNDSDGTPGTEQFGISASTDDGATIASGYLRAASASWDFEEDVATTLVSEATPTNTETISVSYLANIAGLTEAGTYTTDITYIATATY